MNRLKTLVVGLGNPILGDDGIGWRIAETLQEDKNLPADTEVTCLALGGISLMEALIGYERVILIDSILTRQAPIGNVSVHELDDFDNLSYGHLTAAHDTSLQNALKIGHELGAQLPEEITVVVIEAQKVYDFSEQLSPEVAAAIPKAISIIRTLLVTASQPQQDDLDHLAR